MLPVAARLPISPEPPGHLRATAHSGTGDPPGGMRPLSPAGPTGRGTLPQPSNDALQPRHAATRPLAGVLRCAAPAACARAASSVPRCLCPAAIGWPDHVVQAWRGGTPQPLSAPQRAMCLSPRHAGAPHQRSPRTGGGALATWRGGGGVGVLPKPPYPRIPAGGGQAAAEARAFRPGGYGPSRLPGLPLRKPVREVRASRAPGAAGAAAMFLAHSAAAAFATGAEPSSLAFPRLGRTTGPMCAVVAVGPGLTV